MPITNTSTAHGDQSKPQGGVAAPPAADAEDHYFSSNPPPRGLADHVAQARLFIDFHAAAGRRVVLVTSGGTTVPLEKQTVRFIDNFSAGTRGATSAEYFLEAGYAVIFLHRQFSLLPYSRHYSHTPTNCFLDFLHEEEGEDDSKGKVVANPEHAAKMLRVLRKYRAAKRGNMLLMLPFITITDYLYELRAVAQLMRPLGPSGLLYLAAAVSDFFVPPERMAEHKIQSTDAADGITAASAKAAAAAVAVVKMQKTGHPVGVTKGKGPAVPLVPFPASAEDTDAPEKEEALEEEETFDNFDSSPSVPRSKRLIIDLDPVPKFLKNLVDGWAPEGMIVSFKLETDPAILVHKAKYSLERYQHHLVIGNLLSTRKWEVVFVSPRNPDRWIRVPINRRKKTISGIEHLVGAAGGYSGKDDNQRPLDPKTLPEGEPEMEIESLIIPAVQELHSAHVETYLSRRSEKN